MKRKHKLYAKPKKLYDAARIKSEDKLVTKYGLKNKREIWKAEAKVNYFRSRAKALITADRESQESFFAKLTQIGLKVNSVADVLALGKEDVLKRRLSTVVADKGLANTPKEARQMIAHKRILVDGRLMNIPSYLVGFDEENKIELKKKVRKKVEPVKETAEEAVENAEEVLDNGN